MRRRDLLGSLALALSAPARSAGRLARVTIGAENDWLPYSGERDGRAQGMTVELVTAAFAAMGIAVQFELLPYARCMAQTRNGALAACFNTTRTALIESDFLWPARPMFSERFLIYARADDPHTGPPLQVRDLEGQQVAVTRGYEYGSEFDANPRTLRVVTGHDENNFQLLLRGRARYTLAPEANTRLLLQRRPELAHQFKVVGALSYFGIYTTFSRHHPDARAALAAFDEGMRLIHASGQAKAIQERWRQDGAGR
ncbi:ABC transporter substrate-binding protein [Roseateles sp.]|uniref:substrate-binding periplasmic protein n=1 Tax=Roseateles sp. TaxID=1971397 RepID=UPI0025D12976|nr:transporter substrate-binding domain-containing protein [Roseateles sp.]MBV8036402.1 transporter substrate-binding domain-containing protein [Roseateles sp.]